jgi:hypothetical protein
MYPSDDAQAQSASYIISIFMAVINRRTHQHPAAGLIKAAREGTLVQWLPQKLS